MLLMPFKEADTHIDKTSVAGFRQEGANLLLIYS